MPSGPVRIIGFENMAGRVAASASLLYAKNLMTFLETMVDKEGRKLAINTDDELVRATLLTHGGRIVHPAFAGAESEKPAAAGAPEKAKAAPAKDGKDKKAKVAGDSK